MSSSLDKVYAFIGEESFLKTEYLEKIKSRCFPGYRPGTITQTDAFTLNYIQLDGSSVSVSRVVEEACQLPFMNKVRLVVLKDAENIIERLIEEYIKAPVETTCLVLFVTNLDKRFSIYKSLKKYAKIIEFNRLLKENITKWIKDYLGKYSIEITGSDAVYIAALMENDLLNIQQELEKLISFMGCRKTVTTTDIKTILSENKTNDVFDLTNTLQAGNTAKAISIINKLFSQGISVYEIIGTMRWMLTRLWSGKDILKHKGKNTLRSKFRISYYGLPRFIEQVNAFSTEELKMGIQILFKISRLMRTYSLPDRLLMETLIVQLSDKSLHSSQLFKHL